MSWKRVKGKRSGRLSLSRKIKPVWNLYVDGITYSSLSKFFICRERFRLAYVEGWVDSSPREGLEFGNAFHRCLELRCGGMSTPKILLNLAAYELNRIKEFRRASQRQVEDFHRLMGVVGVTFQKYVKYWETEDKGVHYVDQERPFDIEITIPQCGGRKIRLRGKIDGVFERGKELWILEHKTKGRVDEVGLLQSLPQDLQTMIYAYVGEILYKRPIHGVCYDVIRRSGIQQRKGGKKGPGGPSKPETVIEYLKRVGEDINKRTTPKSSWYFMRWETELEKGDLKRWVDRTLQPTLIQIVKWWESVKHNPFDPWQLPDGTINDLHWQRPFGIFDSGADGNRGDFFDLLTKQSTYGLVQRDVPFPELVVAT